MHLLATLISVILRYEGTFRNNCWFHGSSFKGFSIVFPAPWLAKVESSQKSNGMWFFRHFFAPYLFDRSRNNRRYKQPSRFSREKMFRKHIWRCWDDSRSMEPTNKYLPLFQKYDLSGNTCHTTSLPIKHYTNPGVENQIWVWKSGVGQRMPQLAAISAWTVFSVWNISVHTVAYCQLLSTRIFHFTVCCACFRHFWSLQLETLLVSRWCHEAPLFSWVKVYRLEPGESLDLKFENYTDLCNVRTMSGNLTLGTQNSSLIWIILCMALR